MTNYKYNLKMIILFLLKNNILNQDVLEKIIDMYIINYVSITDACYENWSFAIFKLINNNVKINHNHLEIITDHGNLEILKYFIDNWTLLYDKHSIYMFGWNNNNNNIYRDKSLIDIASSKGYLEIIKYLIEHKTYSHWCTTYAVDIAIINGNLDIVKYLISKNVRGTYNSVKKIYEYNIFNNDNYEILEFINKNENLFLISKYEDLCFFFNK
jgi:hypothetical protein